MDKKLLIIFSDKFSSEIQAKKASNEIKLFTNSKVKYYYDKLNSYFLFDLHEDDYDIIDGCLYQWLGEQDINYLMISMGDRNNIHLLPGNVYRMLNTLDNNKFEIKIDTNIPDEKLVEQEKPTPKSTENGYFNIIQFFDDDDSDDLITKIKNKKKEKTIDQILDKINTNGITSLTEEELKILKRKSTN